MIVENIYTTIALIITLLTSGFCFGVITSKFQTKKNCEEIHQKLEEKKIIITDL